MRHPRHLLSAAAVLVAVAATAACGQASVSATGSPTTSAAKATTAATAEPAASSASPTTWSGAPGRDPRAGIDKAVLNAKPVVTTSKHLPLSESEQRAAAAWASTFLHASHIDVNRLPAAADATLWTTEMTPARHAGYAKAVHDKKATFGVTMSKDWSDHMRATKLERYAMSFEMPYRNGRPDFGTNVTLLRAAWLEYYDLYASPTLKQDVKARQGTSLLLGVVRGPDAARPFQITSWEYLDQEKNSRWYTERPDGTWELWKN